MNVRTLQGIGQDIARMVREYHGGPTREMLIDPALYAWLRAGAVGRTVKRQYHTSRTRQKRPARIDFRVGGSNPVLVEFAVRPPTGGGQLYGSQNQSELRKLTRFSNKKAKLRALLLIDLAGTPYGVESLEDNYKKINAGRGRFKCWPVQVIYAHAKTAFNFKWSPRRAS